MMPVETMTSANVKQAVPFFGVTNMEASLRFYVDGLGFKMKHSWIPDRAEGNPDGRIRWCWLELGEAAIMLQVFAGTPAEGNAGNWSQRLFSVRRRAGALSRVQIARNPDTKSSICGKPLVGCAGD
jgi:catechol 2,3-dioxygenase-like lactoylglutathione lyase family enzyme